MDRENFLLRVDNLDPDPPPCLPSLRFFRLMIGELVMLAMLNLFLKLSDEDLDSKLFGLPDLMIGIWACRYWETWHRYTSSPLGLGHFLWGCRVSMVVCPGGPDRLVIGTLTWPRTSSFSVTMKNTWSRELPTCLQLNNSCLHIHQIHPWLFLCII